MEGRRIDGDIVPTSQEARWEELHPLDILERVW